MDVEDRFWFKVRWSPSCWEWIGAKNIKGYGNFNTQGKYVAAHRYSWKLENGEIPTGKWVLHKCDNPSCVRPDHLFLGDVVTNNRDMWEKGRGVHPDFVGKNNPRAKLSEDDVRRIRDSKELQQVTALEYGITQSAVSAIVCGRIWKHL